MSTGGSRQREDRLPIVERGPARSGPSIGGMTAVGITLLVVAVVLAVGIGPGVASYVVGALGMAFIIGGRIVDAIRAR